MNGEGCLGCLDSRYQHTCSPEYGCSYCHAKSQFVQVVDGTTICVQGGCDPGNNKETNPELVAMAYALFASHPHLAGVGIKLAELWAKEVLKEHMESANE